MAFAVGDTVGPYRITGQIGQGGMATVCKAYHANLKVLHPAFKEDPTFLERFKREARIVARLEHPHIVPVYDFADFEGQPYLIMKFIEGETLKARLKRQPLALDETLHILATVASALTYAHDQGILHRDIKPSNIMLDQHGTPYIADFGLARIAQAGESTMSQDMMLGTPQYISPEQAKGIHDLGPGTDIYSLGVVLYELMVGRVPFNADTPYAIVHDHIYKPLPLPSTVNPAVPLGVERVLLKALAKDPEARYQSAVEMVDDFRQAVQAEGLTELSATHYRPLAISSTAETLPETISPPPTPTPQYVVVPSPVPPADSTASRRAYRRRANLWIMGGFGALLLTCLASLFIIVSAVSDPNLRPWNIHDKAAAETNQLPSPPGPVSTPDAAIAPGAMTPGEDPAAYLYLTMSQLQADNPELALTALSHAIDLSGATSEQIASVARRADTSGHTDIASWLYLEALTHDGVTPGVRGEAGEYLYNRIRDDPGQMRVLLDRFMVQRPDRAAVYTLNALALLANDRILTRRQALDNLNTALDINDTLAETYLVRGLYYQDAGQPNAARADWQRALSFDDTPDWVSQQAERLLQETG
jgi:serine/threonine protein kinase/Tfp pilus assembly protein PilF